MEFKLNGSFRGGILSVFRNKTVIIIIIIVCPKYVVVQINGRGY